MQISSSLSLPFYSPLPITSPPPSPPPSLTFSSSASSFLGTTARIAPVTRPLIQGRSFVLGLGRRRSRRSKKGLLIYNALFGLGVPELVVIAGVAALVFGPKKLPEVGRSIGKTVKSFQQAAKEFESELKKEPESSSTSGSAMEEPKQASEVKEDEKVASKNESA